MYDLQLRLEQSADQKKSKKYVIAEIKISANDNT